MTMSVPTIPTDACWLAEPVHPAVPAVISTLFAIVTIIVWHGAARSGWNPGLTFVALVLTADTGILLSMALCIAGVVPYP